MKESYIIAEIIYDGKYPVLHPYINLKGESPDVIQHIIDKFSKEFPDRTFIIMPIYLPG